MKNIVLVGFLIVLLSLDLKAQTFSLEINGRIAGNFNIPTRNIYFLPVSYYDWGATLNFEDFIASQDDSTLTLTLKINNNSLKDSLNIFIALNEIVHSLIDSNNFQITYDSIGFLTFRHTFIDYSSDYVDGIQVYSTINENVTSRSIIIKLINQTFDISEQNFLNFKIYSNVPRGTAIWMPLQVGNVWQYDEYYRCDSTYYEFQYKVVDSLTMDDDIFYTIEKWKFDKSVWTKMDIDTVKTDSLNNLVNINNEFYFLPQFLWENGDYVEVLPTFQQLAYYTSFDDFMPGFAVHGTAVAGVGFLSYYSSAIGFQPDYDIYLKGAKINGVIVYGQLTDIRLETNIIPNNFFLSQNYPNPFNPSTKISWQAPIAGWQRFKVYDILGREVKTLVDEYRNAGSYEVEFDASNLPSGVYFYQLKSGHFIQSKQMILLK